MIQFKNWRQYTHVVNGVRFPPNVKEPFVLIYFSENSNFIDDYPKLGLRHTDIRIVATPQTTVPRTRMTPEFRKMYKALGLLPYTMQQKIPPGRNVIIDLSQYTNAIDVLYKPTTYRQRAGFFITNILKQMASSFPNNYQKILFYSVDTTKNLNKFVNKKIFPVLKDMKGGDFEYDHMLINYIDNDSSRYRLLVKDSDYKFQRVMFYIRNIKGVPAEEELENETKKAARIVSRAIAKDLDSNILKVTGAIEDYLETNPDEVVKITSGDANADDVRDIATTSILYGVSGDKEKAMSLARQIPKGKKRVALKAVNKSFSDELISSTKSVNLSTDPRIQVYEPEKMNNGKSPEHVYQKRQVDFKTNLKKDLSNSFKVLEAKEIPLKFKKITFADKPQRAGEVAKSDLTIANIVMTDNFGNTHNVEMELPRIDPDTGVFRLNGKQKCLVNQIVQNPITFPAPGESRFESSYSIFRIYVKKMRRETYLEAFMSYKMPLMFLLAFSFGFDETLKRYKIKYEIVEEKPTQKEFVSKIDSKRYIIFKDLKTELQRQLCQSFIHGKVAQYNIDAEFGSKDYFEQLIIKLSGRLNSTFLISSNLQNIVDPVAKQVLKNQQLPTDLELIMKYMAGKVVDGFTIPRNDISNQRIRNSEVLVHLAQKQILAAYTVYKEQVLSGNTEAKLSISPTKVLSDFLLTELVVDMEYANPIEEIATMTRISPAGKKVGGIPDARAIHNDARNLHPSYFGNIDPLDTPEGPNIGIAQQLTIDAVMSSSRGMFGSKDLSNKERSGMLSATTSMIPFLENTEGARVIMLANQAKQMLPLKNPQPPVVQSGYESILTGVLSDNFVKKAPCNGKILKVTKDQITVQCGKRSQTVDISPIHLRSGSGKNTLSVFNPLVKVGDQVKLGEVIAEGACMSNGSISLGRPLLCAMMPYDGYNFEDGAVISESVTNEDKLTSLHGIEEEVLISPDDRILHIANIGEDVEKGQPLLRKTLGEVEQIIGYDEDESTDLFAGQFIKKSPGGKVVDIEVFSNVGDDAYPKLEALIKKTNRKYKKPPRESFKVKGETIKGILIRFRIEQSLRVGLGDKLCNRYGNKGIISLIEKDELMPRMPNGERIEIVFNPLGMLGRMNIGQLYEMYCGLMARELGRRMPTLTKAKSIQLINQVYSNLDTSANKKTTKNFINNLMKLPKVQWDKLIAQVKKTGFYPIVIPPFQAPSHTQIKKALNVLGLKTKYKLTLPKYNTKTAVEVSVGYMYISKLEHLGDAKIYGRSSGPVTGKTGQPTAGKRREGGQRLGELDTYSFISYNCPGVLAEFMGPLSDDYITREEMLAEIVQKGSAAYKEPKISPAKDLLNSYFISLMLTK